MLSPIVIIARSHGVPLNCSTRQLYLVSLNTLRPRTPKCSTRTRSSTALISGCCGLIHCIGSFSNIRSTAPILKFYCPGSSKDSGDRLFTRKSAVPLSVVVVRFLPRAGFFSACNFHSNGKQAPKRLSSCTCTPGSVMLARGTTRRLFRAGSTRNGHYVDESRKSALCVPIINAVKTVGVCDR